MARKPKKLFVSDLVGSPIVTVEGKCLGHVVDLKVTPDLPYRISEVLFGSYSWLYRFDVLHPFVKNFGINPTPHSLPWEAVDRFERFTLYLKKGREKG